MAETGIPSSAAIYQDVKRGNLPEPIQKRPKKWLRAEVLTCLPEAYMTIEAVEDAMSELDKLAESMARDTQDRSKRQQPGKSTPTLSAHEARLQVCRLAQALADQAARLVAVPIVNSPTGVDDKSFTQTILQINLLSEQVLNMGTAYLAAQGRNEDELAQGLDQTSKEVRRRLRTARQIPTGLPMDSRQLDFWLTRYKQVSPNPEWPVGERPSNGLALLLIQDELRQLDRQAAMLEEEPPTPTKSVTQFQVHQRKVDLYASLIYLIDKKKEPKLHNQALKDIKESLGEAKEAYLDYRHARPTIEAK